MAFAPTVTHESKAIPGVKFTVHRMGFGRRTDLEFKTLQSRQRLREIEADYPPQSENEKVLAKQLAIAEQKSLAVPAEEFDAVVEKEIVPIAKDLAAAIPLEVKKQRAVMDEEYQAVDNRVRAEWIRAGLVSIEGGELEGMTAEQLLDYGPPPLASEVYSALVDDGKLRGPDAKNLPSGTTSVGQEGGGSPSSTVENAAALQAAGT